MLEDRSPQFQGVLRPVCHFNGACRVRLNQETIEKGVKPSGELPEGFLSDCLVPQANSLA